MKKLLIAAAASLATITFAAPAQANYCDSNGHCVGSANDYARYQQRTDPGYNGARYNGGYYEGGTPLGNAIVCLLFCGRPKNKVADVCYDANGQMFALDRQKHWYHVEGSTSVNMSNNPSYRRMWCGFNEAEYAAK